MATTETTAMVQQMNQYFLAVKNVLSANKSAISAHVTNTSNPHNTTAAQVGLGNVSNYKTAVNADYLAGTSGILFTTPAGVKLMIDTFVPGTTTGQSITSHIANKNNPHSVTAGQIGLGNVSNYATASIQQTIDGTANDLFVTPSGMKAALSAYSTDFTPTGAVAMFAMPSVPNGWIYCNGQQISRSTYAKLFSLIGTIYGAGDGSTTFNVPDLRGEFIRGWDDGRGVDASRGFGTWQEDMFKSHMHLVKEGAVGPTANGELTSGDDLTNKIVGYSDSSYEGGVETRPRNIALIYCIKA